MEAGYLKHIFTTPLYLVGYESLSPSVVEVKTEEPTIVKELKLEKKPEVVEIPKMPNLTSIPSAKAVKCMILYTSEEELKADELSFCTKIMKACGLEEKEFACVNFNGISINDVKERYEFVNLLLMGTDIPGLKLAKYTCTQVKSTKIIAADALWLVQTNVEFKSFLWSQLQVMFGLKK